MTKIQDASVVGNGSEKMSDAPGGGHIVTIKDPEGFLVNFIHGQTPGEPGKRPEKLILTRRVRQATYEEVSKIEPGPAAVHKLRRSKMIFSPSTDKYAARSFRSRGEGLLMHNWHFTPKISPSSPAICFTCDTRSLIAEDYRDVWSY